MNPAGEWRLPKSEIATPQQAYHADAIATPFARAASWTASHVALVRDGSGTTPLAQTYVPSPKSKRIRMDAPGFAEAVNEISVADTSTPAARTPAVKAVNLT